MAGSHANLSLALYRCRAWLYRNIIYINANASLIEGNR